MLVALIGQFIPNYFSKVLRWGYYCPLRRDKSNFDFFKRGLAQQYVKCSPQLLNTDHHQTLFKLLKKLTITSHFLSLRNQSHQGQSLDARFYSYEKTLPLYWRVPSSLFFNLIQPKKFLKIRPLMSNIKKVVTLPIKQIIFL